MEECEDVSPRWGEVVQQALMKRRRRSTWLSELEPRRKKRRQRLKEEGEDLDARPAD